MTLLKCDGFEGYDHSDFSTFWDGYRDSNAYIGNRGRRGGNCFYSTSYSGSSDYRLRYVPAVSSDTFVIGWAYMNSGFQNNNQAIFQMWNTGSPADPGFVIFAPTNGMYFEMRRQWGYNYQYVTLGDFNLEYNTWYYIEVKIKAHSSGIMVVRINEQEILNVTGDNVVVNGTNGIAGLDLRNGTYCYGHVDDVYILDTNGTVNNDFLGDIRVDAIHPNGAGNYTQLTPSAGNNYECIDETNFDSSDYVEDAVAGNKDSYSYANVPTDLDDNAIYGVQVNSGCKRSAQVANREMKNFLRTGGADYEDAAAKSLGDTYKTKITVWEDDPSDSNDWTQAKINACEFGVEVN